MDFWILLQERAMIIFVLAIFIVCNLLLAIVIWRRRVRVPKPLLYLVTIVSTLLILLSSVLTVFIWTFGYNA